jgi:hypothetical protein
MKRLAKKKTVPPPDAWVSEDPETTKLYEEYFKQRALRDGRISRKFICEVNPEEWRHVIRLDESAIIVDADTGKEELIVVRRALGNEAILQEAQKVAMRQTELGRGARVNFPLPPIEITWLMQG